MISQVIFIAALAAIAAASILPVEHHAHQPYKFGYDIKDKHGEQYRQEEGNGGHAVKGSYGFTDARGVKREVGYVADHAGFRAQVKTNEPGTANQNPAAVQIISDAPYAGGLSLGAGAGLGGYGPSLGGAGLGGYGFGVGRATLGGYGSSLGVAGYGLGNAGLGYGVVAPGYAASVGIGGIGYGLGSLGYARYGY